MNTWKSVFCMFFSPARAFQSVSVKPVWLVPFVLIMVVSLSYQATVSRISMRDLRLEVKADPDLTREEMQRRLDNIDAEMSQPKSVGQIALGAGVFTLMQVVKLLGMSLTIWLVLQVIGYQTGFRFALSTTVFASLVKIPEAIVRTPLVFLKGTTRVYLSPASLLPYSPQETPVCALLNSFDLFTLWSVALLAEGSHQVMSIPRRTAWLVVGILWIVWIVVSVLFGGLIRIS